MAAAPHLCPRCRASRLSVVYYNAKGEMIGGHSQCTDCGARHSEPIPAPPTVREKLLARRAS